VARGGEEDLEEDHDEDPEEKANHDRILRHAANRRSHRPQAGFKRDEEGDDQDPEPQRGPTRAQDVEARACDDETTEYRSGRQKIRRQSVEYVEEEARYEQQRGRARMGVRPHGWPRDMR